MTWLTWQGIRDLATCEAQAAGSLVRYVPPYQARAVTMRGGRPITALPSVAPTDRIYARDVWRDPWRRSLAQVPRSCVLLTTFNDAAVQAHATRGLLEGTSIRRWFAVQCATRHPRLTAMPIGIDGRDVPALAATPAAERDIWLLANFQPRTPERRQLLESFPWATVTRWPTGVGPKGAGYGPPMSIGSYYAQIARSRFVLSPAGRGWDCYRTYEAMALGAIPIVKRCPPQSDVVDGLPALVIDDWRDVTPDRLAAEWDRRQTAPDLSRMTLAYWQAQIQES